MQEIFTRAAAKQRDPRNTSRVWKISRPNPSATFNPFAFLHGNTRIQPSTIFKRPRLSLITRVSSAPLVRVRQYDLSRSQSWSRFSGPSSLSPAVPSRPSWPLEKRIWIARFHPRRSVRWKGTFPHLFLHLDNLFNHSDYRSTDFANLDERKSTRESDERSCWEVRSRI